MFLRILSLFDGPNNTIDSFIFLDTLYNYLLSLSLSFNITIPGIEI